MGILRVVVGIESTVGIEDFLPTGVVVSLKGPEQGSDTTARGVAEFRNLPRGDYQVAIEEYSEAAFPTKTKHASVTGSETSAVVVSFRGSWLPITEVPSNLPAPTPLEERVRGAFQREFDQPVFRPAICETAAYLLSTAYVRNEGRGELLILYMSLDASTVLLSRYDRPPAWPADTIHTIVALIRHEETMGSEGLTYWTRAQEKINGEYVALAVQQGYGQPVLTYVNTNIVLDLSELPDPKNLSLLKEVLTKRGYDVSKFNVFLTVNIDPAKLEGGFAGGGSAYIGNFNNWTAPLSESQWKGVANAAYHHEVGHLFGWQHEWTCSGSPFITSPALFGWTDLDGDQVPEIIDRTPYGRSR